MRELTRAEADALPMRDTYSLKCPLLNIDGKRVDYAQNSLRITGKWVGMAGIWQTGDPKPGTLTKGDTVHASIADMSIWQSYCGSTRTVRVELDFRTVEGVIVRFPYDCRVLLSSIDGASDPTRHTLWSGLFAIENVLPARFFTDAD